MPVPAPGEFEANLRSWNIYLQVVVTVVLLNLLIAIMGESFSKVVENEEQQFLKGRAELIDEVEVAVLGQQAAAQNGTTWFPRYLHILRPGQQSVGDEGSEYGSI